MVSDRALLRLGAQMAEIEALYACVLDAADAQTERRLLIELATAAARLSELARATGAGRSVIRPPNRATSSTRGDKLQRRIARTQRTADWIIARAGGGRA